ncbi:ubiquinone biosynthesis regulatory protein kinase UbiB, partial [Francisella tularensis subsp. holarctica]|nr:ubiquinone biosynthesis regulatory protein kinase UbiB [Francisella tularensis subsp. holarctica]
SDTRVDVLESAIRSVCEPIFEKPMTEISLGNTLMQLCAVARRFNMNIQPQLTHLQKTLFHLEVLGEKINTELNIWETYRP